MGNAGSIDQPSVEELENVFESAPYLTVVANFDLINAVLPFPTIILFAAGGNEPDGTIDTPLPTPDHFSDTQVPPNSLAGFSTIK